MSYEIISSLSFSKDFKVATGKACSNNVYPRTPSSFTIYAKENQTGFDFVKNIVGEIIDGSFVLPQKHLLNLYVYYMLKSSNYKTKSDLWVSVYDFDMKLYDRETHTFTDPIVQKQYETRLSERDSFLNSITHAFMNKVYAKQFKRMKNEIYVLTNYHNFVSKYSKKKFYYTSNFDTAQKINAIDLMFIPQYILDQYKYEALEVVNAKEKIKERLEKNLHEQFTEIENTYRDYLKENNLTPKITREEFVSERLLNALKYMRFEVQA